LGRIQDSMWFLSATVAQLVEWRMALGDIVMSAGWIIIIIMLILLALTIIIRIIPDIRNGDAWLDDY
jgi:hypothetical protein